MRVRWRLIVPFVLATVLVDGVVVSTYRASGRPYFGLPAVLALAYSQVSLAGIWMVLGQTPAPLRMLGTFGVIISWCLLLRSGVFYMDLSDDLVLMLIPFAAVTVLLLTARWLGLRCTDTSCPASPMADDQRPFQFSVAYMLAWTTVLAIVLGVSKWLGFLDSLPRQRYSVPGLLLLGPGRAMVALAALWAVLGGRWPVVARIVTLVLAAAASLGVQAVLGLLSATSVLEFFCMFVLLEALLLVGSLLPFRMAGYRVLRKKAVTTETGGPSAC